MTVDPGDPGSPPPTTGDSRLGPVIAELRKALTDEVHVARNDPSRMFGVSSGIRLTTSNSGALYHFKSDIKLPMPTDTPVVLTLNDGETVRGEVVGLLDFDVFLALKGNLGESVDSARVSSEPWFIWEALEERLGTLASQQPGDQSIPLALVNLIQLEPGRDDEAAGASSRRLGELKIKQLRPNEGQREAMSRCAGSRVHFIWGPPGTGKTAALAQVAATLVRNGERVLVLAHANVAVDVAVLRIAQAFEGTEELAAGRILRVGTPQLPEVRARGDITPEDVLARTQPDLVLKRDQLESARSGLTRALQSEKDPEARKLHGVELEQVSSQLTEIRELIRAALTRIVSGARVLAGTLSRLAIDDQVFQWPVDAVLVDEASMAPFPAVFAAGQLAAKRIAIFGDFRQLPPIVLSTKHDTLKWLGRDSFEIAGLIETVDRGQDDPRMTLLDTQYRMSPHIAELVSDLSYSSRLRTAPGVEEATRYLAALEPLRDESVVLVDTSALDPACVRDPKAGSFSRANPLHAALAIELGEALLQAGCPQVAIVTPYRAQARLISSFLHDHPLASRMRSATVHRFQGSESDGVIVDLVDGPTMHGASRLTGKDHETARRLLNVAMSRAIGKLLVLANVDFIRQTQRPMGVVPRTIARLCARGREWRPTPDELVARFHSDGRVWSSSWSGSAETARELADNAKAGIQFNLPAGLDCPASLVSALVAAADRIHSTLVFAGAALLHDLEETRADLRLMNRPGGVFLLADSTHALVGGSTGSGAFLRLTSRKVVDSLESVLVGQELRASRVDADAEHALDSICGRCPECGEYRRPTRKGGKSWALACGEGHKPESLQLAHLNQIVTALRVTCRKCGLPGSVVDGSSGLFLACSGAASGCRGSLPRLELLLGRS